MTAVMNRGDSITGADRIAALRGIVEVHGARKLKINGKMVMVDAFTASACVQIHDGLNEANRAKYLALPWERFIDITWKLVKECGK